MAPEGLAFKEQVVEFGLGGFGFLSSGFQVGTLGFRLQVRESFGFGVRDVGLGFRIRIQD